MPCLLQSVTQFSLWAVGTIVTDAAAEDFAQRFDNLTVLNLS